VAVAVLDQEGEPVHLELHVACVVCRLFQSQLVADATSTQADVDADELGRSRARQVFEQGLARLCFAKKDETLRDALSRLETMIAMAALDLPEKAMRQQIANAIQVVIQVSRLGDGTRKITNISEITGMEGDVITMQDIFIFERQGVGEGGAVLGHFKSTGIRPKFADRLKAYGIDLAAMLFSNLEPRGMPSDRSAATGSTLPWRR